ncbi:MAG TPA: hypothetical protein VFN35_23480 [Ktedonobacteraceae bacterium]|nr:hypothetical protein [Ktedonobacteraceae bacterium]
MMQDAITQSEQHASQGSGDLPPFSREPNAPRGLEAAEQGQPVEMLKGESAVAATPPLLPQDSLRVQRATFPPRRGLSYAAIAGVIAGVLAALLTIVITLVNAGTFHTASQQIAVDRLTVKTALALAAWELLTFMLSLLIGFFVGLIIGRIAVRRRLGFLAGALAGAVFSLITFFVNFIPSYPGNLTVNGTSTTTGSLVISFLLLCLWSIGGGLVSLFGTWITTVRHPHYLRHET